MAAAQLPSVGRIVVTLNNKGEVVPAIVNKVWTNVCVNLTVFDGESVYQKTSCVYADKLLDPVSWAWPTVV